jgi:hypothetical protein
MRHWQYKVVVQKILVDPTTSALSEDHGREELLNRYGQEGWELVSVVLRSYRRSTDPTSLYGYTSLSYYCKKEAEPSGVSHTAVRVE